MMKRYIKDEYEDTLVDHVVSELVVDSILNADDIYVEAIASESFLRQSTAKQQELAAALTRNDEHRVGVVFSRFVRDYVAAHHRAVVEDDLEVYL
jgi:hypothetical protein